MKLLDILLVEDDLNDCDLFGMAVDKTDLNIRLQIATESDQAIDYLEGRGVYAVRSLHPLPALVVLDFEMRLTGGLEFLGWRKASATFWSLPLVIFSDFAYKGAIETALAPKQIKKWGLSLDSGETAHRSGPMPFSLTA